VVGYVLWPSTANVLGIVRCIVADDFVDRRGCCGVADRSRLLTPAWRLRSFALRAHAQVDLLLRLGAVGLPVDGENIGSWGSDGRGGGGRLGSPCAVVQVWVLGGIPPEHRYCRAHGLPR
jgi:hypothetical protein